MLPCGEVTPSTGGQCWCWKGNALTGLGEAPGAPATAAAVSAHEHGDAVEAVGLGHGRPEVAVGAVRVGAAPRPRLPVLRLVLRAALTTVGRAPVPQPGHTHTHT